MMTLLLHLQARGQASGQDLARLLEVSERTVQRDVGALVEAGIPVRSAPGPGGGYRLDGGYRTRLTGVGLDQAGALAFLGLAGQARDRARHTAERFHLDPVRWYGTPEPVPCLPQLAMALWRDRRARIEYVRRGTAAIREISPLGLVLASGQWYLLAYRDGQRRTYRVSRVRSAELLDQPADRPDGFDVAQTWAQARRELEHESTAIEVTVRVEPGALPRLRQLVPVHGQDRVPLICTEPAEVTVPFESENWACAALLSLGMDVEVLRPAAMRGRVAGQARGAAARYA